MACKVCGSGATGVNYVGLPLLLCPSCAKLEVARGYPDEAQRVEETGSVETLRLLAQREETVKAYLRALPAGESVNVADLSHMLPAHGADEGRVNKALKEAQRAALTDGAQQRFDSQMKTAQHVGLSFQQLKEDFEMMGAEWPPSGDMHLHTRAPRPSKPKPKKKTQPQAHIPDAELGVKRRFRR